MSEVLFVLQNAWRRGATAGERGWSADEDTRRRAHWKQALWKSHTGKRLREMIPDGCDFEVINASPFVGDKSWAVFTADPEYVLSQIDGYQPRLVVLCGNVAAQLAAPLARKGITYLRTPHPAYRLLSKVMTAAIREEIAR